MKQNLLRTLAAMTAGGLLAISTGCQSTDAVDAEETTYAAKDKKE